MLHYHVWFNLKPGVAEPAGLQAVRDLLAGFAASGDVLDFQLTKNSGAPPRSRLPAYHALAIFADAPGMAAAMRRQTEAGIHHGAHGRVVDAVCDFHVEVFHTVALADRQPAAAELAAYACEI